MKDVIGRLIVLSDKLDLKKLSKEAEAIDRILNKKASAEEVLSLIDHLDSNGEEEIATDMDELLPSIIEMLGGGAIQVELELDKDDGGEEELEESDDEESLDEDINMKDLDSLCDKIKELKDKLSDDDLKEWAGIYIAQAMMMIDNALSTVKKD